MKLFTTVFLILFSQLVISQSIPKNVTNGIWIEKEFVDSVVKYHSLGKYVSDGFILRKSDSIKFYSQVYEFDLEVKNGRIAAFNSYFENRLNGGVYSIKNKKLKFNRSTSEYIISLDGTKFLDPAYLKNIDTTNFIDSSIIYLKYIPQDSTFTLRYSINGKLYSRKYINNYQQNYFVQTFQHFIRQLYIHGDYDLYNDKDSLLAKGVSLNINHNIIKYFDSKMFILSFIRCPTDFEKSKTDNGIFKPVNIEGCSNERVIKFLNKNYKEAKSFIYEKVNDVIYFYQIDTIKFKWQPREEGDDVEGEYFKRGKMVYKLVNQKVK